MTFGVSEDIFCCSRLRPGSADKDAPKNPNLGALGSVTRNVHESLVTRVVNVYQLDVAHLFEE